MPAGDATPGSTTRPEEEALSDTDTAAAAASARAAAAALAELTHLTHPANRYPGLQYPDDVFDVLAGLHAGVGRLPQVVEQLGRFLERETAAARVQVSAGAVVGDGPAAVATAREWLARAAALAGELTTALRTAQLATSGLVFAGGGPEAGHGDDERPAFELSEFAAPAGTDYPVQGVWDHLVQRIIEVLPVTAAGVTLVAQGASPRSVAGGDDAARRYQALETELGEGPGLAASASGAPVMVPDLAADDRFPRFGPRAVAAGLAAVFAVPIDHAGIRLGTLDLYRDTPGDLDPPDLAVAQTLADRAAASLTTAPAPAAAPATTERFRQSGSHDPLTGLPNRVLLAQRLEHAAQRGRRSQTDAAVLFVDLAGVRAVTDTHGRRVGDGALIAVARRLASVLRSGDTVARVSEVELAIVCEDLADASYVEALATRIERALTGPFDLAGVQVAITASVGLTFVGRGMDLSAQLMSDPDLATDPGAGQGAGHQVIDLRAAGRVRAWRDLARDLPTAVAADQLHLDYQPVVRAADGLVTGVEALLRWTHPTHGPVAPRTLVAVAEQHGLITELGAWVLARACRDRRRWLSRHQLEQFDVAVNVSATQLLAPGFGAAVAAVLAETGTDPPALILELTETVFTEDVDRVRTVLLDLKGVGVGLALDDFGTGYAALRYLRRFPVDVLKIDQALLADIDADPVGPDLLAAVTNLAHLLRLSVTAEGVETRRQRDEVAAAGCESAQGYFYARPMPADEIARILHDGAGRPLHLPATVSPSAGEQPGPAGSAG